MKIAPFIRKMLSFRSAQIIGQAIVLCLLVGIFAACAAPPPPVFQPVFQPAVHAAGKIACDRSPVKAIAAFPRVGDEDGFFVYEARMPSQRDDGRQRTIRVKLPEGLSGSGMEHIQPVEVCPLTRSGPGSCSQNSRSIDMADLHSMAKDRVTELFRFEVVDLSKLKNGLGKGVLPKDALLGNFEKPIEIWIEFYQADQDLLAETERDIR